VIERLRDELRGAQSDDREQPFHSIVSTHST
jgi:hypothetical protein